MAARLIATIGLVAAAFVSGYELRAPARAEAPEQSAGSVAPNACEDSSAMQANRNLAGQVRDYKVRLEAASAAEPEPKKRFEGLEVGSGAVALELPCATWNGDRVITHYRKNSPEVGRIIQDDAEIKAQAAGLEGPAFSAIEDAYRAARTKLWKDLEKTCDSDRDFRASWAERLGDLRDTKEIPEAADLLDEKVERCITTRLHALADGESGPRALADLPSPSEVRRGLLRELEVRVGIDPARKLLELGALCTETHYVLLKAAEPTAALPHRRDTEEELPTYRDIEHPTDDFEPAVLTLE